LVFVDTAAAVLHFLYRFNPQCRRTQQFQDLAASIIRKHSREFWPRQNLSNFLIHIFRRSYYAFGPRDCYGAAGQTIGV